MKIAVCLLALLACAHAEMTWTSCGDGAVGVKDVVMSPDPAVAGQNIKISIEGSSTDATTDGTVDISVAYRGVHVYQTEEDLCKRTACPVKEGPLVIHADQDLPSFTPPGPYTLQIMAADADKKSLLCLEVDFEITAPSDAKGKLKMMAGMAGALGHKHNKKWNVNVMAA